ncbi:MAG: TIGR02757 family protein [Bacteroidia bacterium]|jgi:uncharacterized protein (TIGR02757 family)
MDNASLRNFLDLKVKLYNVPAFIEWDPISIPHRFKKRQDIEIMGLIASLFAWGQRTTIINKSIEVAERMQQRPHDFVVSHQPKELKQLLGFKHRTFNDTDLLAVVAFLHRWYKENSSLETAFSYGMKAGDTTVENALNGFRELFFREADMPNRTRKHIASPRQNSACKRLNMYLRWMVRKDRQGVDFGLWKSIGMHQLVCPLDVHVQRVAIQLGLMLRNQADWKAAIELTENLKRMDPKDPVRYDFALFGMGINSATESGKQLPRKLTDF